MTTKSMLATLQASVVAMVAAEGSLSTKTLTVAAAGLIHYSDLGADNAAKLSVQAEISKGKSEASLKALSAWMFNKGKAIAAYGDMIRGTADKPAEERVKVLVAKLEGDGATKRTWNDVRAEFRQPAKTKADKADKDAGDGAGASNAALDLLNDAAKDSDRAAAILAIVAKMQSMADLNLVANAVTARLASFAEANLKTGTNG